VNIDLSTSKKIYFYLDSGYNFQTQNFPRLESGLIKGFNGKIISGLLAIGYSYEIHAVKAYLFVHL